MNDEFNEWIKKRGCVVNAFLEKDSSNPGNRDPRNIYALQLSDNNMRNYKTLNELHFALSYIYHDAFHKQFGYFTDGKFKNPTGRTWQSFIEFLNRCSETTDNYVIPIELYDPVTLEMSLDNQDLDIQVEPTTRKSRTYSLRLSREDFADAVKSVSATNSDSKKNKIYHEFWTQCIFKKASDIWDQQRVLKNLPEPQQLEENSSEFHSENSPSVNNEVTLHFTTSSQTKKDVF
jgi:hypothetical protein